jgi:hypothetical protein
MVAALAVERPGLAEALSGVSGEPATVGSTAGLSSPRKAVGKEINETHIVCPDSKMTPADPMRAIRRRLPFFAEMSELRAIRLDFFDWDVRQYCKRVGMPLAYHYPAAWFATRDARAAFYCRDLEGAVKVTGFRAINLAPAAPDDSAAIDRQPVPARRFREQIHNAVAPRACPAYKLAFLSCLLVDYEIQMPADGPAVFAPPPGPLGGPPEPPALSVDAMIDGMLAYLVAKGGAAVNLIANTVEAEWRTISDGDPAMAVNISARVNADGSAWFRSKHVTGE